MANRRVTIWRYAKIDGKWKYHKPNYGRNNKINRKTARTTSDGATVGKWSGSALPQCSECRTGMLAS